MLTRRGPGHVYNAMMVLGGNGTEERFSALPRLWRDAAILETWEGPYTPLLMQALGDLVKFGVKGRRRGASLLLSFLIFQYCLTYYSHYISITIERTLDK